MNFAEEASGKLKASASAQHFMALLAAGYQGLGLGLDAPRPFHSAEYQLQPNLESEELGLCGPFARQRGEHQVALRAGAAVG